MTRPRTITKLTQLDELQDSSSSPFFASSFPVESSDSYAPSLPARRMSFFNRRKRISNSSSDEKSKNVNTIIRKIPNSAKRGPRSIACSHDAAVIITGYQCGQVWIYLRNQHYHPIRIGATKEITQVACSADGSVVAYASKDGLVRAFEASTQRPLAHLKKPGFEHARGVALSADGLILVASFSAKNDDRGMIVRHHIRLDITREISKKHSKMFEVYCSSDATRILFVLNYGEAVVLHAPLSVAAEELCTLRYMRGDFDVAISGKGDRVVIMDNDFNVLTVQHNDLHRFRFSNFTAPSLRRCDIDGEGSRVIEMRKNYILVRRANFEQIITELEHKTELRTCCISGDGSQVVALDKNGTLILWELPWRRMQSYFDQSAASSQTTIHQTSSSFSVNPSTPSDSITESPNEYPPPVSIPGTISDSKADEEEDKEVSHGLEQDKMYSPFSPLENLYSGMLRGVLFSESEFISALREDEVRTCSALICGHNLLLIAFRMGLLDSRDEPYLFYQELYLPSAKLLDTEEAGTVKKILRHAEHLGFINSGESVLALSVALLAIKDQVSQLDDVLQNWGRRINAIEVATAEQDARLQIVEKKNEQHLKATAILAQNLTLLHDSMKRQNKALMYANIAKCILSLLPVVGSTVGNAAFSATEVILNMSSADLVGVGVSLAHSAIDHASNVDVSNIQVLSYVLRNQQVRSQVEETSFKQVQNLNKLLQEEIERKARDNPKGHYLDLSHSLWRDASVSNDNQPPASQVYQEAARFYDIGDKKSTNGSMPCDAAVGNTAYFLKELKGIKRLVPEDTLHKEFEKIAGDDVLRVNRHEFATVCDIMHSRLMQTPEWWRERFRTAAEPNPILSIRTACKVLEKIWELTEDFERARYKQKPERSELMQMLLKFDFDGDHYVNCDEFCKTAHYLIHSLDSAPPISVDS